MHPVQFKDTSDEKLPFEGLKISDKWKLLSNIDERSTCPKCGKSRKYFCYTCYVPVIEIEQHVPKVHLPLKIDIIKHAREIDGKSTAAHAAVLAPDDVRILTYPCIPTYKESDNVVLIYPDKDAYSVSEIVEIFKKRQERDTGARGEPVCKRHCSSGHGRVSGTALSDDVTTKCPESSQTTSVVRKAVFIDSTWNQSKGIYKDKRLKGVPRVILRSRLSQFWRHQKGSPRWYLATIEALHQFLVELHESVLLPRQLPAVQCVDTTTVNTDNSVNECASVNVMSNLNNSICESNNISVNINTNINDHECNSSNYNGEYDNLLFFFRFMYTKIHTLYSHDSLLSYKRPVE